MDVTYSRIPWLRKAESWNEADGYVAGPDDAAGLPEFPAGPYPLADFKGERPRFFVAVTPAGRRYLVNTEGYDSLRGGPAGGGGQA